MEWIADPQAWIALVTLTLLEIVLGIDNIIFISILTGKLPLHQQPRARTLGLGFAMITRLLLLFSLVWLTRLTAPLFTILEWEISVRDLVLILGGAFLIAKATMELHNSLEGEEHKASASAHGFMLIIVQIAVIDLVFSLDSVITAVGMAQHIEVMALAIVIAVIFMMMFAGSVSRFIDTHPTLKVLALSFLLMVGLALIADGLDFHIPKGYIYVSMAFSIFVETLNIRLRRRPAEPVHLRKPDLER